MLLSDMQRIIRAALVALSLALTNLVHAGNLENWFWLGVLRNDGVLTPFALYENGKWSSPWPEDFGNDDSGQLVQVERFKLPPFTFSKNHNLEPKTVPLGKLPNEWLGSHVIPIKWYLWSEANKPVPFQVTNAVQYESHCVHNWGLQTDYDVPGVEPGKENWWPRPKSGIASNALLDITPALKVEPTSIEGRQVVAAVRHLFQTLEGEEIRKIAHQGHVSGSYLKYTGHPLALEERNRKELSINRIARMSTRIDDRDFYYIEGQRHYPKPAGFEDQGCVAITSFYGWLTKKGNVFSALKTGAFITDCDMKTAGTSSPKFLLSVAGNSYVIAENYGYESEYYTVSRITPQGVQVVLEKSGGGC